MFITALITGHLINKRHFIIFSNVSVLEMLHCMSKAPFVFFLHIQTSRERGGGGCHPLQCKSNSYAELIIIVFYFFFAGLVS